MPNPVILEATKEKLSIHKTFAPNVSLSQTIFVGRNQIWQHPILDKGTKFEVLHRLLPGEANPSNFILDKKSDENHSQRIL